MAHSSQRSSLADEHCYVHDRSHSGSSDARYNTRGENGGHPFPRPTHITRHADVKMQRNSSHMSAPVPSFSAFRSQASSIPLPSPISTKRGRAGFNAMHSSRAASFSMAEKASPRLADPTLRPLSLNSPQVSVGNYAAPNVAAEAHVQQREDGSDRSPVAHPHQNSDPIDFRLANPDPTFADNHARRSNIPLHSRSAQEQVYTHAPKHSITSVNSASQYSFDEEDDGARTTHAPPTHSIASHRDGVQETPTNGSTSPVDSPQSYGRRRKSPPGRPGHLDFFGWKSSSQRSGTESPTTTFSDRSASPSPPSPGVAKTLVAAPIEDSTLFARLTPQGLDIQKASAVDAPGFAGPNATSVAGDVGSVVHIKELEEELTEISVELAASIKREMDLEDELERMKVEAAYSSAGGRRGSDYFTESGASSARYPVLNQDEKTEQLETRLRKAEQEKVQLKLDMASRLQTELNQRKELEETVRHLEDRLSINETQALERGNTESRMAELESSLDITRRHLSDEQRSKSRLEDLYNKTKLQLTQQSSERDDLRHNILPQLTARLAGLEAEAASAQALNQENLHMQQEVAALREERRKLQESQLTSGEPGHAGFSSIAEESTVVTPLAGSRAGVSRSESIARSGSRRGGSVHRSGSVKDRAEGGRQRSGSAGVGGTMLSLEGMKEIEDQRDALHKALRLLIMRHEEQQKAHHMAIKKLTSANNLSRAPIPTRTAYHREVSLLKNEVTTLRKRTEDALEQKWQYEKNLSGLKMDLDRAEQETRDLRRVLDEHDTDLPTDSVTSHHPGGVGEKLELNISNMEDERDRVRRVAEEYRQRAMSGEVATSDELMSSARRMNEFAEQLDTQVRSNVQLRKRLAEAVVKGEEDQKASTHQIEEMQRRLTSLEDSVLAAQQHSEHTLGAHDAEVRKIDEASSPRLQRFVIPIPEARKFPASSPLAIKSPKPGAERLSLLEVSRTQMLECKVRELESLLREAEQDMQEVVQRVNRSQLEVAELQTERDAALTQMRKLQKMIVEERERAEALMPSVER